MIPPINNNKVYVEITNKKHGGDGWQLGVCLWSPTIDRGGSRSWALMEEVNVGDIVLHLVDINGQYHWYGLSIVDTTLMQTDIQPPEASKWANMAPYQRINIGNFVTLDNPYPISSLFSVYQNRLRAINQQPHGRLFYVEYGTNGELRMAQRYFAKCPTPLYNIFDELSDIIGFNPHRFQDYQFIPTPNEPLNPDYTAPGRVPTFVNRIIRDTALARGVKANNDWTCQICGVKIKLPNSNYYAEGHHLKPLGEEGPDHENNIIILCPTHHVEFDFSSIAISPVTGLIEHIDNQNEFDGLAPIYERAELNEFLEFHYHKRFKLNR